MIGLRLREEYRKGGGGLLRKRHRTPFGAFKVVEFFVVAPHARVDVASSRAALLGHPFPLRVARDGKGRVLGVARLLVARNRSEGILSLRPRSRWRLRCEDRRLQVERGRVVLEGLRRGF
jgi:hypothetical protein